MSRFLKIAILIFILSFTTGVVAQKYYKLLAIPHKGPKAVVHIDFKERPQGFREGQFYIYKVLRVTETGVEMGLCRLEVQQ